MPGESSETIRPHDAERPQSEVNPSSHSSAFRVAVEKARRALKIVGSSWTRGAEGVVDAASKAPARLSPFEKRPPSENPIRDLDKEPSNP